MSDTGDDLAPTTRSTPGPDGGLVPGRCAGYVYDGAAYCPPCAADVDVTAADGETYTMDCFPADEWDGSGFGVGVLSGFDEAHAPGFRCAVCHRGLQTATIPADGV